MIAMWLQSMNGCIHVLYKVYCAMEITIKELGKESF